MADTASNLGTGSPGANDFGVRAGRLALVRESRFGLFVSNLRQFLTERQVRIRGGGTPFLADSGFGAGLRENLSSFFQPTPRMAAGAAGSDLLVDWNQGFGSIWQNIRDLISPPKLAPLQTTSKPVAVKDIWTKNTQFGRVQALSVAIHVVLIVLIVVPLLPEILSPGNTKASNASVTPIDISPYVPKLPAGAQKAGGGGGGGEHNVVPASAGRAPKFSYTRFTPPEVRPPEHPKLAVVPTILGPPNLNIPNPNLDNWGDPLAKLQTDSSGPGRGSGIGSGQGGGIGSGNGGGLGPGDQWGTGGGSPHAGENGYGTPVCLYCPQPEFSNEAVKAKYQGVVVVQTLISADGRATNIRVVKGVGLGLDEKAVEAVRNWRFKPAMGPDGRPAAVLTFIEVTFHLY